MSTQARRLPVSAAPLPTSKLAVRVAVAGLLGAIVAATPGCTAPGFSGAPAQSASPVASVAALPAAAPLSAAPAPPPPSVDAPASAPVSVDAPALAPPPPPAVPSGACVNCSLPGNDAVIAGLRASFRRRCYEEALKADPSMKGSVRITVKIGPNGEVLSAAPSGASGLSGAVLECMIRRITDAQFYPLAGGAKTLTFPVTLAP